MTSEAIFPEAETISEPNPEIKRGRGRPVGSRNKSKDEILSETPAFELSPTLISAVGSIFSFPFDIIASRTKEDKWRLTPEEKNQAGELTSKVVFKYLPVILEKYIDEITLALFILTIISERMAIKTLVPGPKEDKKPEVTVTTELVTSDIFNPTVTI